MEPLNLHQARQKMVESLRENGIEDKHVLLAMSKVPRHLFVPLDEQEYAYSNRALGIACQQTISQPWIVAVMTEAANLHPGQKVLEIGTGSGYQAAILAELGCDVYSVEVIPQLAFNAKKVLQKLNYTNVRVQVGNGYEGWREHAPYHCILVTAAAPIIPFSLLDQLQTGGCMVIPLGREDESQVLTKIIKLNADNEYALEEICDVRFVPLVMAS